VSSGAAARELHSYASLQDDTQEIEEDSVYAMAVGFQRAVGGIRRPLPVFQVAALSFEDSVQNYVCSAWYDRRRSQLSRG
jgi:hypothetical protein